MIPDYAVAVEQRVDALRTVRGHYRSADWRGADTMLTGLPDRSALYGVLAEAEALGLDLVEVRQLTRPPESGDSRSR